MSVMMSTGAVNLRGMTMDPLRTCPFCGADAVLEPSRVLRESIRITCGNDACGVRPRTEYLLACYADELCAAWNARPATAAGEASGA
jgi:hypothetical protein